MDPATSLTSSRGSEVPWPPSASWPWSRCGHAEEVVVAVGGVRQRLVDRETRPRLVLRPDVRELERMCRRLDVRQVELGDLSHRLEDRAQLTREPLELVLGQLQPGQRRHVEN